MILSDVSIKRPVFATVISMILVIFGLFSFRNLSVREYPAIDPPVLSITTQYKGASNQIIESQITQLIEDQIAGIEGVRSINSTSREGSSSITVEFRLDRDIDGAANDVRDKVARILSRLPEDADQPVIAKVEADARPIIWFSLLSDKMSDLELTDFADRYLVDRLSTVPGVASVRIGGERRYAMRIWLDKQAMAAREVTVQDIETALKQQNLELPSGRIESRQREFTVLADTGLKTPEQFAHLVLATRDGYQLRLSEVARVEKGALDTRGEYRSNSKSAIGVGIVKQSTANTLEVADQAKREIERLKASLPPEIEVILSYDSAQFIAQSIYEVEHALMIAICLVICVTFFFLRSLRATIIPTVAIPVSIIAACAVLSALGYSINVLTLLAAVLAIGLVVDDAIVVLENIHRHVEEGHPPLLAAVYGAKQIGFAVVSTTMVLIAVFVPLSFLDGNTGRLFREFGISVAAAVLFSGIVALSLSPMMCSKFLADHGNGGFLYRVTEPIFVGINRVYAFLLRGALAAPLVMAALAVTVSATAYGLYQILPKEFAPIEDRGNVFISVTSPEGASFDYTKRHVIAIETMIQPYLKSGLAFQVVSFVAPSFGRPGDVKTANIFLRMAEWKDRTKPGEKQKDLVRAIAPKLVEIPGVRAFAVNPPSLGQPFTQQPVQVVVGGSTYEELAEWRDVLLDRLRANPKIQNVTTNFEDTKPELRVHIRRNRASDLGVSIEDLGRTLETMLGSRQVTRFIDRGKEYDVLLQLDAADRAKPDDLSNIFVRAATTKSLIPLNNLVTINERGGPSDLNRVDRLRSFTLQGTPAMGVTLGEALDVVETVAAESLPRHARVTFAGQSREFKESSASLLLVFGLAILIVYLVLAAQFESFVHPFIIMLAVPLAATGALGAIWLKGLTINVYSQIGMVMLVGIVAKNGILIVEFANQLRDKGHDLLTAVAGSAQSRLRPILMTSIATAIGAVPLVVGHGAGAESREAIGWVIIGGVCFATALTLFIVPAFYLLLAGATKPASFVASEIRRMEGDRPAPHGHAPAE
ncbi:MAG: efflux RND transporter permease subunit [Alphaproteobacteria bacterium]|nr:efflux RND transporter permease subunit [Alphaproteobacteria bacterium]